MADVRILATAEVPPAARPLLAGLGTLEVSRGSLLAEVADADVLLVRAERVDAPILAAAGRLRVIARTGVGVDNVDVAAATARLIPVVHAPAAGTGPIAEGTWALILAAAKRLGELRACIEQDRWTERYAIEGLDLRGSTLGVVGLGSIGREVARVGAAFGMEVLGADPQLPDDAPLEVAVQRSGLEQLVQRADVLTLHCDLNDSTRGLVDRALLQRAARQPILVNAARGGIVDGDELLLEALERGWLSAVGLDVFAAEPLSPRSPLLHDPRVICTPHSIGLTRRWNERVFGSLAADVGAVLSGERPQHVVNPEVLGSR
jgi:D-3-phosphoglycerate dehydrogenase / 2-oxoglutarate reductase